MIIPKNYLFFFFTSSQTDCENCIRREIFFPPVQLFNDGVNLATEVDQLSVNKYMAMIMTG